MKILHIENTAGVATMIAKGERALGHDSDVLETWRSYINYDHDFEHYYEGSYYHKLWQMDKTAKLAKRYDIIHVHSGMAWRRIDYPWIRNVLGKPLVVHYHGSETRLGYGMHYQGCADAKIVATPDLLRWHPQATFIPNPMAPMPAEWGDDPLRIVHMPTVRAKKGTDAILKAVDALRTAGRRFDFQLIEKVPHSEALSALSRAHILVDQATSSVDGASGGLLGVASLEGMAMSKAVVNSLDPNGFGRYYPRGCPGVYADERCIEDVLASLLDDPKGVRRLGERGRRWISDNLTPEIIARRHIEIYNRVLEDT